MPESKPEQRANHSKPGNAINVPYLNAYGGITKALERIKSASTPDRFTLDFLSAKLGLKGGSARPIIPFLKRTGFLNGDGSPTDLYKLFRNNALQPAAAAQAVRTGYKALYEINEYTHDLSEKDLKGVIVQATGLDANSAMVRSILGSFKALRTFADFEAKGAEDAPGESTDHKEHEETERKGISKSVDLKLGYTINLNLPATSDIAVFNAIFKSLREHLLDE
jgi:hypothetical protein